MPVRDAAGRLLPQHDNIVEWCSRVLDGALKRAEWDRLKLIEAKAYHRAQQRRAGKCQLGHPLDQPTPPNFDRSAPCGYCTNCKEIGP